MHLFRRKVGFTFGLLALLLAGLFLASFNSAAAATTITEPLSSQNGPQYFPRTDGKTVVWTDARNGDAYQSKIYALNLSDHKEFQVADNSLAQQMPDIDAGVVVWEQGPACKGGNYGPIGPYTSEAVGCHRDIHGKNLATDQEFVIADSHSQTDETDPAISGNWVVWVSRDQSGGFSLKGRDISTMAPAVILTPIKNEPYRRPAIYGKQVIWSELTNHIYLDADWQLKTLQIGPNVVSQLDSGHGNNFILSFDIQGDLVVYASLSNDSWILKIANLRTGERRVIAGQKDTPAYPFDPTTDGRYVVFEDLQHFYAHVETINLRVYDTQTGSLFALQDDVGTHAYPFFRNGFVVWNNILGNSFEIYGAPLASFLPTVRQPQTPSSADRYYFLETGHNLANGFKNYWDKNGGLAVFGYPQTEEFDERNPDTGKVYTVQYFERQRYEYHPENAGTPYETLLGRLGFADAQRRKLLNTPAFQPVAANNSAGCQYFPETKHAACGNFLAYWRSHGLDLDEPGNSYRESLALFGYPLSEAYTDPQTGFLTQYFERARFEYHPENKGTPYEVLLGLLGDRELQNRGWVAGTQVAQ